MKPLILTALLCSIYSCSKQSRSFRKDNKEVVKIVQIDSTDNAYFVECEGKVNHNFILVSWRKKEDNCSSRIEIGRKYKIDIDIETIEGGDYDGYMVDGREFSKETTIAYTDDLEGLCLVNN